MPDPTDPTPCTVVKRGGGWAVVDKHGRELDTLASEEAARAMADSINGKWAGAKKERRAKGAPPITEAWSPAARAAALAARKRKAHVPHDEGPGERLGLEGPFRYRSGWTGYYDAKAGRYYDHTRDVHMPRDFDPHTGEGAHPKSPVKKKPVKPRALRRTKMMEAEREQRVAVRAELFNEILSEAWRK